MTDFLQRAFKRLAADKAIQDIKKSSCGQISLERRAEIINRQSDLQLFNEREIAAFSKILDQSSNFSLLSQPENLVVSQQKHKALEGAGAAYFLCNNDSRRFEKLTIAVAEGLNESDQHLYVISRGTGIESRYERYESMDNVKNAFLNWIFSVLDVDTRVELNRVLSGYAPGEEKKAEGLPEPQ